MDNSVTNLTFPAVNVTHSMTMHYPVPLTPAGPACYPNYYSINRHPSGSELFSEEEIGYTRLYSSPAGPAGSAISNAAARAELLCSCPCPIFFSDRIRHRTQVQMPIAELWIPSRLVTPQCLWYVTGLPLNPIPFLLMYCRFSRERQQKYYRKSEAFRWRPCPGRFF